MNIQILNNDLTQYGIVAGFESLEFTRAFNAKGSFRVKINANNSTAKYIKNDKILYIDNDKIGYIDKVTIDRKTNKAGEYIIAEGVELKDRLNRLIYPDSELESDSYTNEYLEVIVKSLINKNAGSLAASARQIANLNTAANQNRGLQIDYSARYKDVSTEIYSLLSSQEMGLKASIDLDNTEIIFDVAVGNDNKATIGQAGGIVLSLETKTALEIVDTDDKLSFKNLSVTAGQGEGADRTIEEVYTEASEPSGYNRREVFTDGRDVESDDELPTRGAQKLSEISKTRAISAKANTLGSYQVGDDYDLGDYISVDAKGELYDAQIVKLKYKYQKDRVPEIDVSLNFDVDDTLYSNIKAKHMDYDALLANEAAGGRNLVAEGTLAEDAVFFNFSNLDITADGGVYEVHIYGNTDTSTAYRIEYNGVTTNYKHQAQYLIGTASYVSQAVSSFSGYGWTTAFYGMHSISLANGKPSCIGHGVVLQGSATLGSIRYTTMLLTSQTEISSIKVSMANGKFKGGTTVQIVKKG